MWGKPSKAEKQELSDFIKKYNEDYVLNEMPIDDYIIGKGNKTSFCYLVERGISFIGTIAGLTSFKFGVYYGKTKNDSDMKYRFDEKFGKTVDEAFDRVKIELASLIKRTKKLTEFEDIESIFVGTLKYKIMYMYNPDIIIPHYSTKDLQHYCSHLGLTKKKTFAELQRQLFEYRNKFYPDMSNLDFAYLINIKFGRPLVSKKEIAENEDLDLALNKKLLNDNSISLSSYETKPVKKEQLKTGKNQVKFYPRDVKQAKIALALANYSCEYDKEHYCFERRNGINYTEVHHLIPLCFHEEFEYSLDVPANIVSLCSNCHNEIHYGKNAAKLIEKLYNERKELLEEAKIGVSLKRLLNMYKQINTKD